MIRTSNRFYWSDALYLARAKNLLTETEQTSDEQIFRCSSCTSFVKFKADSWVRIKPFEQFLLQKRFDPATSDRSTMKLVRSADSRELWQCPVCASHWWNEGGTWNPADDALVDSGDN